MPGLISGSTSVANLGSSSLNLSGTNTFTGSVTVQAGTLSVHTSTRSTCPARSVNSRTVSVPLRSAGTGTTRILDYEGTQSFTLPRPISMTGGGVGGIRIINATGQLTVPAGSISGNGGFEKLGNGTIIMQGAQHLSGPVTDVNGNLNIDTVADIGQPSGLEQATRPPSNSDHPVGRRIGQRRHDSFNNQTRGNQPPVHRKSKTARVAMSSWPAISQRGAVATSNLTSPAWRTDLTNSVSTTGGTGDLRRHWSSLSSPPTRSLRLGNVVSGINNSSSHH